jgi:alkylhydroperoxidase family enzyme
VPRIPYPDPAQLQPVAKAAIERSSLNVNRMLVGASPAVLDGFFRFAGAFYNGTRLPADLREIAILRAGYIAGSDYETWQHESLARDIGMTEAQLDAVKKGGSHPGHLSAPQQAVLDFVDEFVQQVGVSDAALAEARRHLSVDQLIDLMLVTGLYMTISRFLETTGVPRDTAPITSGFMAEMMAEKGQPL